MNRSLDLLDEFLTTQYDQAEAWGWAIWLSDQRRAAERTLAEVRNKLYDPSGASVLERELNLAARSATYQETAERLRDRSDLLNQRILFNDSE